MCRKTHITHSLTSQLIRFARVSSHVTDFNARNKFFTAKISPIVCLFVLYVILALLPPVLQIQLPAWLFVCILFILFLLFVVVLSGEPKQNQGRGLVDRKLVQVPRNSIAGRPMATLLFWFFGDFRCCVRLFIVILVIYK